MPLFRRLPAGPLLDHRPHRSLFPANFQCAAAWRSRMCSRTAIRKAARPGPSCAACPGRPQDIDIPVAEMAVQLRLE